MTTKTKVTTAETKKRERVKQYAKDYVEALYAGQVPAPSGADCWICLMFNRMGSNDSTHTESHIQEKYYVPSLLVNAAKGNGVTGISLAERSAIGELLHPQSVPEGAPTWSTTTWMRKSIEKTIRKYVYRQLGMDV